MNCSNIFRRTLSMILAIVLFVGLWPADVVAKAVESINSKITNTENSDSESDYLYSLEEPIGDVDYDAYLAADPKAQAMDADFTTNWASEIESAKNSAAQTVANGTDYYVRSNVLHLTGSAEDVSIIVEDHSSPAFIVLDNCTIGGRIINLHGNTRDICIISIGSANSIYQENSNQITVDLYGVNLYICGDADLAIKGSDGKNGTGSNQYGHGSDGADGVRAVLCGALFIDIDATLVIEGGNGGNGSNGANSTVQGSDGADRKVWGGTAGDGGKGGTGGSGGSGGDGADAMQEDVYIIAGTCWLIGGKGGNGGNGGKGGKGGSGGDNTAWGGSTGDGGQGGDGGFGGNAGTFGLNIVVNITVLGDTAKIFVSNKGNGVPGSGGEGGDGGNAGVANPTCGSGGVAGPKGQAGPSGSGGQAYSNWAKVTLLTLNKRYDLYTMATTWEAAAAAAREKNAWLVSINSAEEMALIGEMYLPGGYWIGLSRQTASGADSNIFQWQDGTRIRVTGTGPTAIIEELDSDGNVIGTGYANWRAGEPNNSAGSELYVHLYDNLEWNDAGSTGSYGYITEQNYYTVTVEYISEDGVLLQTEKHQVVENGDYTIAVDSVYGYYTTIGSTLSGNVGMSDITLQVICKEKYNTVKIEYKDLRNNEVAFTYEGVIRSQDGEVAISSPMVNGYKLVRETDSEIRVTWKDQENGYVQSFVVEYCLVSESPYTICTMLGSQPVAGMTVIFNGQTKVTNSEGKATFTYTQEDVANGIGLQITGDGYYCEYSKGVSDYPLNAMGIGYVNLLIDTETNPNFSVVGDVCFGKSLSEDYGYINVKYNGHVPISVYLNATGSSILKACLVQDQYVYDGEGNILYEENENGEQVPVKQRVILQTIEAGNKNMSSNGQCVFSVPASKFFFTPKYDCPIYVYMYVENAAGIPVIQELNIIVISLFTEISMEGLFKNMSLTLNDTGVDFLDGLELSIETDSEMEIPLDFSMSNNEIYVGLGIDCEDFLKKTAAGDALIKATNMADAYLKRCAEIDNQAFEGSPFHHAEGKMAFESKLSGGFVIEFCENGVKSVSARMALEIKISASYTYDMVVLVIPVTCSVSLTGTGRIEIVDLAYDLQNQKVTMPKLEAKLGLSMKISMGVGCRFASVGASVQGNISINLVLFKSVIYDVYVEVSVSGGVYAKLTIGFFTLKAEKMWSSKPKKIYLVKEGEKVQANGTQTELTYVGMYHDVELYALDAYTVDMDEVYAALDAESTATVQWNVGPVKEIDYAVETASPKLVEVADGVKLMVYFASDSTRHFYDAKKLVYRVYDEENMTWSAEQAVDDDLTADAEFSVYTFEGKAYLAYTNSNSAFTSDNSLTDAITNDTVALAQKMEIVTAVFDADSKTFVNMNRLTSNEYYDSIPVLNEVNGTLYLAWRQNRGNDQHVIFGSNKENYVYMSKLTDSDGNAWSEPVCLLNKCYPITDMAITGISGEFQVVLVVDEDTNLYSTNDRNLYFVGENAGTLFVDRFGMELNSLQTGVLNGNEILMWYNGGTLYYIDSVSAEPKCLLNEGETIGENYIYANLSEHVSAVFWMETGVENPHSGLNAETISEIYVMYKYGDSAWTQKELLTYAAHAISDYDVIVTDDESLMYTIVDTYIEAAQTEEDAEGEYSNLTLTSKLCYQTSSISHNLTGSKTLLEDEEGQKLEVVLQNNGPYRISDIKLKLIVNRAEYSCTVSEELLPGESKTITLVCADDFNCQDALVDGLYQLSISAYTYYDLTGNPIKQQLIGGNTVNSPGQGGGIGSNNTIDYTLTGDYIIIGTEEYISLRVDNVGTGAADKLMLQVIRKSDGQEVYATEIETLYSGNYKFYLIKLEKDFFAETYEDFVCKLLSFEKDSSSSVASIQSVDARISSLNQYTLKETEEIIVQARKVEGQAATVVDELVEAPILSSYYEVFDIYTNNKIEISIDMNGDDKTLRGDLDEMGNDADISYYDDGSLIYATVETGYLNTFSQGMHELYFLYTTENGNYLRTTLQVEVVDNTPIQLAGNVTIVDAADGKTVLESATHGMVLQAQIADINAEHIEYQWMIGDEIVSTNRTYYVDNANLGHEIRLVVTSSGVYYGELVSQGVYLKKVDRELDAPIIEETDDELLIRVLEVFHVGDGKISYGYATVNDPQQAVWSDSNKLELPRDGKYYIFIKVSGGAIYADVISEGTEYVAGSVAVMKGDIDLDGDVDATDLTLLARHVAGIEAQTNAASLANADVNNDGFIDANDLTTHARFVAGIITSWDDAG